MHRAILTAVLAAVLAGVMLGSSACGGSRENDTSTASDAPGASDTTDATRTDPIDDPQEGLRMSLTVTSAAYEDGDPMPARLADANVHGGEGLSPPLSWEGAPEGTASFAVVIVDRHPVANDYVHWMVVDIPAPVDSLSEGASGSSMPEGARELRNTAGGRGYMGPRPPQGTGDHPYEVTVYALDTETADLPEDASLDDFAAMTEEHALAAGELTGTFAR